MEIVLTIGVLVAAILLMSIGVLFNRKPLRGSCGGHSNRIDGMTCPTCAGKSKLCITEDTSLVDTHSE